MDKIILAIHGYSANNELPVDIQLNERLSFISLDNTNFTGAYKKYCLEKDVDDGSPFDFSKGIVLNATELNVDEFTGLCNPTASDATFPRTLNTITISNGCPIRWARIFWTNSDMSEVHGHKEYIDHYNTKYETLNFEFACDNEQDANLKTYWKNIRLICATEKRSRLKNSIDYFYTSWNSTKPEHFILNTSIIFETLFSPGNSELSHRISFYIAKFIDRYNDSNNKEATYKLIKKFYGIRSKIVHGAPIDSNSICELSEQIYPVSLYLLRTILLDENLIKVFSHEKDRVALMEELIFS